MNSLNILERAREILESPEKWTQGCSARYADGWPCSPVSEEAESWCLTGAIGLACAELGGSLVDGDQMGAIEAVGAELGGLDGRALGNWNDSDERMYHQVLSLLDRTIDRLFAAYAESWRD